MPLPEPRLAAYQRWLERERGWLWLLDDRYTREEITRLLPARWGLGSA